MTLEELRKLADSLVGILDSYLTTMKPFKGQKDAAVLAILIRSAATFKVILKLLEFNNTGGACVALSRSIIEAMIGLEYMDLVGMDAMLKRFLIFETAEAWEDIKYLRSRGVNVSALDPKNVRRRFLYHKKILERKPGETWRSWAHTDFDGMVDALLKSGKYSADNLDTVLKSSVTGNRKLHLSTTDVKMYVLGQKVVKTMDISDRRLGFVASMSSLVRIGIIYAKRRKDKNLADKLEAVFKQMDKA